MNRTLISSGAPWEPLVGYSRAVRVSNQIHVAGTTSVGENGILVGKGDAYAQTRQILTIIKQALEEAGASMDHVVRTRVYITDISTWEQVGRAHGEFFGSIRPASTMVEVAGLIDSDMLVEIEATAIVPDLPLSTDSSSG